LALVFFLTLHSLSAWGSILYFIYRVLVHANTVYA
jgi:hypothetical protein